MAKILLVEDELFVRELYERILRQANFETITAVDFKDAEEKVKENPDLILLDILLPGQNGLEFLKKIKSSKETKDIPVLMLTNLGQESVVKEAISSGAQGYIMKMRATPYELISHIKEFLQNPIASPNPAKLPSN